MDDLADRDSKHRLSELKFSCFIGKDVWVAPSVSVLNKLSVSKNAPIGMGAVVVKNLEEGQIIVGNPGKPLQK